MDEWMDDAEKCPLKKTSFNILNNIQYTNFQHIVCN